IREFAVRAALGCGTRRLLQQLTAEILALFVVGGLAGLLVAFGFVHLFTGSSPFGVLPAGGISLDAKVLGVTAVVIAVTAVFFGSLPAARTLRIREIDALRSSSPTVSASRGHLRSRRIFV